MKTVVLLATLLILSTPILAQHGGIGVKPRTDLVMLGAVERDSLADEIFARITDIRTFAETSDKEHAAPIIGWMGAKTDSIKWTRPVNLQNADESTYVQTVLAKADKLFKASPESHRKYFAVFKEPKTPGGRKYLYQIEQSDGKHNRMVSWTFYGNGDKLMLGDFN
jgi:hypothetical protein